ncbi:MAG: N-acetyltransferase [Pseudomonadota bacterium]
MIVLRDEMPGEGPALHALTDAAFKGKAFADGTEGAIIGKLREAGDLLFSHVADAGAPVGHVALSPASIAGEGGWIGLGPISVAPGHQKQGIGTRLMEAAIAFAKAQDGAKGIVLLGDPAYYGRFGFIAGSALTFLDVPKAYVQYLRFTGAPPEGEVTFAPALQEAG